MANTNPARVALYVATETVAPGASNLLAGNYKQGLLHAIAGAAAAAVYGPAGALLVAADSVHKALTGVNLYDRLGLFEDIRPSSEPSEHSDLEEKASTTEAPDSEKAGRRRPPRDA